MSQSATMNTNTVTVTAPIVTPAAGPKSLPMKYKAMLCASISFIHNHIPEEQKGEYYNKLPLYASVEEQMAYFDTKSDIKQIEQTIYKPMVKEQKKKEKEANKPVKEKKPRAPRKKKEAVVEQPVVQETTTAAPAIEEPTTKPMETQEAKQDDVELEFENTYTEEEPVTSSPKPPIVEKKEKKTKAAAPKVPKEPKTKKTKEGGTPVLPTEATSTAAPKEEKVKKPKGIRKTKEEKKEAPKKDVDYYMVPPSVIPEGRFWTEDEDFRNGQLFSNGKDEDGDSAPAELIGKLVDGKAVFDN